MYRSEETAINTVIAADIARRSPDQTVEQTVQCAGTCPFEEFVIETNNFQDLLVGELHISHLLTRST